MKPFAKNGSWVNDTEDMIASSAAQFGAGLFETIRIQNGRPLLWQEHMTRLKKSAISLEMDAGLDVENLEKVTHNLIYENAVDRCSLKILWLSDAVKGNAYFYFRPLEYENDHREKGMCVGLSEIRRNPYSRLVSHKTVNYLENSLERRRIKPLGFDEALILNTEGFLAEGITTNVFILHEDILITPSLECGILPGVQRQAVLDESRKNGIPCEEKHISLNMLYGAQGIYLTNSLMGFMPVLNFMGNCYDRNEDLVSFLNKAIGIRD